MVGTTPPLPSLTIRGRVVVEVGEIVDVGETPHGHVRMVPILGGRLTGWLGDGQVLHGGADWQVLHLDGTVTIDARYSIRLESGQVITFTTAGVRTSSTPSGEVYFRVALRIGAPDGLADVVRRLFLGSGLRHESSVVLDLFEVG